MQTSLAGVQFSGIILPPVTRKLGRECSKCFTSYKCLRDEKVLFSVRLESAPFRRGIGKEVTNVTSKLNRTWHSPGGLCRDCHARQVILLRVNNTKTKPRPQMPENGGNSEEVVAFRATEYNIWLPSFTTCTRDFSVCGINRWMDCKSVPKMSQIVFREGKDRFWIVLCRCVFFHVTYDPSLVAYKKRSILTRV